MSLTSHSSLSSTITGGAGSLCWPGSGLSDAFRSKLGWNTSWIFMEVGSSSQHDDPTNALILKGLTFLWSNFFDGLSVLIFFVDNHIWAPTSFSTLFRCWSAACVCFSWLWAISVRTNFYISSMSVAIDLALLLASRSRVDFSDKSTGLKLILGTYPRVAWNGGILVVEENFALAANLAMGSRSTQLFWKWLT